MNEQTSITKAKFGELFGVSAAQLERFFQKGMPCEKKGRNVVLPMPEAREWYKNYLVDKGRREAQPTTLDEAKMRREAALAELAELDLSERRAELMTVAEYERLVSDVFARIRARLLNFAPRVAGLVLGAQTIQEAQARVEPLVREIMEELRKAEDVPQPEPDEDLAA